MDERFKAQQQQIADLRKEMNEKFKVVDNRFDRIEGKLDCLLEQFGSPFKQFARNVVVKLLAAQGIQNVNLSSIKIPNPYKNILNTNELEIDGFSKDPAVIVEITSILHDKDKVDKFLKKKQILEKIYNKHFKGFFIATSSTLTPDELSNVMVELRKNDCDFINL
ncbi:MAG: hypothetical protein ACTSRZ_09420 [Promethearchaeota archaeon]